MVSTLDLEQVIVGQQEGNYWKNQEAVGRRRQRNLSVRGDMIHLFGGRRVLGRRREGLRFRSGDSLLLLGRRDKSFCLFVRMLLWW